MNQFLRGPMAVFTALFLVACQTLPQANKSTEPTPVATTIVADTQGVISRFTNDIWPAINAYNFEPWQVSPGTQQFNKIIYRGPDMDVDQHSKLRAAAEKLGTVQEGNQTQPHITHDSQGLHLADTALTALDSPKATLQVCYTFTADTRQTINDAPNIKPFDSEATIELRKTDSWYLYAITDDHVVQGCSGSQKA